MESQRIILAGKGHNKKYFWTVNIAGMWNGRVLEKNEYAKIWDSFLFPSHPGLLTVFIMKGIGFC